MFYAVESGCTRAAGWLSGCGKGDLPQLLEGFQFPFSTAVFGYTTKLLTSNDWMASACPFILNRAIFFHKVFPTLLQAAAPTSRTPGVAPDPHISAPPFFIVYIYFFPVSVHLEFRCSQWGPLSMRVEQPSRSTRRGRVSPNTGCHHWAVREPSHPPPRRFDDRGGAAPRWAGSGPQPRSHRTPPFPLSDAIGQLVPVGGASAIKGGGGRQALYVRGAAVGVCGGAVGVPSRQGGLAQARPEVRLCVCV